MKTLALVVPCRNEFARLNQDAFVDALERRPWLSFCFVDDGSTDRTAERLAHLEGLSPSVHAIYLPRNVGKAEAVRTGIRHLCECSHADLFGFWDADLATPLDEVDVFVRMFDECPQLEAAIGSRWPHLGASVRRGATRSFAGELVKSMLRRILGEYVWDTQCGAKVFSRSAAEEVFDRPFRTRWLFDVELLMRFGRRRLVSRVREVPLMCWRDVPGSKIGLLESARILVELANMIKYHHAHTSDRRRREDCRVHLARA